MRKLGASLASAWLRVSSAAGSQRSWTRGRRLAVAFFPACLGPCQLLLFGPHTLHSGNAGEFSLAFSALLSPLVTIFFITVILLLALAVVIPARLYAAYVALLSAFGFVSWVQGNLLLEDFGPLDGTSINWSAHTAGASGQLILWVGLPMALALLGRRIVSQAAAASAMLIGLQVLVVAFSPVMRSETSRGKSGPWRQPPERMSHFSSSQNIVHLILDGFQGDVFGEIVERDAELRGALEGFVFFSDHAGAFPTTSMSIPAMLTGVAYRNESPTDQFIADEFARRSIFTELGEHGYDIDFAAIVGRYFKGPIRSRYALPRPYGSYQDHRRAATAQLFDLSLFRHAPSVLKRRVYNNQEWWLQRQDWFFEDVSIVPRVHHAMNGRAFLFDLMERMEVAQEAPVYKVIHIGMPHRPLVVDGSCDFIGVTPVTRQASVAQARCTLLTVVELFRRLRDLGIYDDSLIVLASDHGSDLSARGFLFDGGEAIEGLSEMAGSAGALLAVKRPGAEGPLVHSAAPSAITDIPATIADVLGLPSELPGVSVFRLAESQRRAREYAHYEWTDELWDRRYLPTLDVYEIRGPIDSQSSWGHRGPVAPAGPRP